MYAAFSDRMVTVPFEEVSKYLVIPKLINISVTSYLEQQKLTTMLGELFGNEYTKLLCSDIMRLNVLIQILKVLMEQGIQFVVVCGYMWYVKLIMQVLDQQKFKYHVVAGKINNKVKDREIVKKDLLDGKVSGVVTTTTYDVGVDVPSLQAMVFAYPFMSSIKTIQRAGRVARQAENKTRSLIIDMVDLPFEKTVNMAKLRAKLLKNEFGIELATTIPAYMVDEELTKYLKEN